MDAMTFVLLIIIIFVGLMLLLRRPNRPAGIFEDPKKWAGKRGEQSATKMIQSVLWEEDHLLTNVQISFEGKIAELDTLIVNKYGVFIIEVKNYRGMLRGGEDEYEWCQSKVSGGGDIYRKMVKNPIRQVRRQTYVLAKYLEYYGCSVWVEGRAFFVQGNCPVESSCVLHNAEDIDRLIHTFGKNRLSKKNVEDICRLLV